MRKKIILTIASAALVLGSVVASAVPAQAAPAAPPVRAGIDNCGNFQIWVNGNPIISWFICHGG